MINAKMLKTFLIVAAAVVLVLNYRMLPFIQAGEYPPEGDVYVSIVMSLLPAAILIVVLRLFRGGGRTFNVMLGVLAMSYAWSFISDPWSVSLRMGMGLDLMPMLIYTVIGSVFLFIAVYAFKQV
jgi:branched-subunit amino acid transport protein AzlD